MKFTLVQTLAATLFAAAAVADTLSCSADSHCPEDFPCCSNEGTCGTGSYCLGPCDPRYSFNSSSCMPAPACKAGTYTPRAADMMNQTDYLGNTSVTDFIYYGEIEDQDDSVIIKMPAHSVGGVISSTFYLWYGKVSFKFKTSHNAGVVSAAILFSQVQDEIDYEFVGSELEVAETNFYFEGTQNYTNSVKTAASDTYANWHTYEIDWSEDSVTWSIDGVSVRTLNKADTYNDTSKVYDFPQTPSRLQFSIWPAGDPTKNAPGTVEWAGGDIDWNAKDFSDPGYLFVALDTIDVVCYDPPSDAQVKGNTSYIYDGNGFLQSNVIVSDKETWMKDLGRTGFNTGQDKVDTNKSSSARSSSKASSSKPSSSSSSSSSPSSSSSSKKSSSRNSSSSLSKQSSSSIKSSTASSKQSSSAASSSIRSSYSSASSSLFSSASSKISSSSFFSSSSYKTETSTTPTLSFHSSTSTTAKLEVTSVTPESSSTTLTSSSTSSSSSASGFVQFISSSTFNAAMGNNVSFFSFITLVLSSFFLL